jgi:hypothetical protein
MKMKITFSYSLDRDVENFIKSAHSANNKKPTKLQELYIEKFGKDFDSPKVKSFIESYNQENKIDFDVALAKIDAKWRTIRNEFIRRAEDIFGAYPSDIFAYLSTNSRCTYNIDRNYFFVFVESKNTNAIIAHELWHFYTWHCLHVDLIKDGVSSGKYNDIKESLTELLNLECKDLLEGHEDKGYPQHAAMREFIRKTWVKNNDLKHLINQLTKVQT